MNIAVLEWITGGGLAASTADGDAHLGQLQAEGRAMLECLVSQFSGVGDMVHFAWDSRIPGPTEESGRITCHRVAAAQDHQQLFNRWIAIARRCDWTIVVAPECDGILESCIDRLVTAGIRLLNCQGRFLSTTADKLQTAEALHAASLPHPPTIQLSQVTNQWLQQNCLCDDARQHRVANTTTADPLASAMWVVKPRVGAGCEALQIALTDHVLRQAVRDGAAEFIVQPYLRGAALSRCALVNRRGDVAWLPQCKQEMARRNTPGLPTLAYLGSQPTSQPASQSVTRLLASVLGACGPGALGWIGVDFLLGDNAQYSIVEVNPRVTSSIVAFSEADWLGPLWASTLHN